MKYNKAIKRVAQSIGALVVLTIFFSAIISCCVLSSPEYNGQKSDHYDGDEFYNPGVEISDFWDILAWQFEKDEGYWPKWIESEYGEKPPKRVGYGELRVVFVNHSTVLLQFDSLNVLTDPIWSERCSPVSWIGPKRHRNPGVRFEDLPPIDFVLISHNHYDHLDMPTLKRLYDRFSPIFLAPLGNKRLLNENGISPAIELDWMEDTVLFGKRITLTPAQHFSMRGLCDKNETLWGGFVVETLGGPLYFVGDTGFGDYFKLIYDKFGSMRFSMLPVGAFRPKKYMEAVHCSPAESVEAHLILHSHKTLPIHWGTFRQADDSHREPIIYLKKALKEKGVSSETFFVPTHGEGYYIPALESAAEKLSD